MIPEKSKTIIQSIIDGFLTGFLAVGAAFGILAALFGVTLLLSLPTYWLWNWLMPAIFNLPEITWWQAWGLTCLCSILFKTNVTTKQ